MIISASRRTDIPAFHSEWFFNRLIEGYVITKNPMNAKQMKKVSLHKEDVDCIVFWTKNPQPMLSGLEALLGYNYYFHYTLTGYSSEIERNLPALSERLKTLKELSAKIGADKIIWRYDPIILTDQIDVDFHVAHFEKMAKEIQPYVSKCIISFLDAYPSNQKRLEMHNIFVLSDQDIVKLSQKFTKIAYDNNLIIETCSEGYALETFGICHGKCIDAKYISSVFDIEISPVKDKNQRENCGCNKSIDIGAYSTCKHDCVYCYATHKTSNIHKCMPYSPILCGQVPDEIIESL